jgi:hypothetical protein
MRIVFFFLAEQSEKLFFDEFDELFGKFSDASVLAFAELVAQAKSLDDGNCPSECVEVTKKVRRLDR